MDFTTLEMQGDHALGCRCDSCSFYRNARVFDLQLLDLFAKANAPILTDAHIWEVAHR
jgi:hypothetical protein